MRPLGAIDKLLLGVLLPAWALAFVLHLQSIASLGLAQPPVYLQQHRGDYPVIAGYQVETGPGGTALRPGDRLLAVDGHDMKGRGDLHFRGLALRGAGPDREVEVRLERAGGRQAVRMGLVASPVPWARTPALVLCVLAMTVILLRAPDAHMARLLFGGGLALALGQTAFYGPSYFQTVLYWLVFWLGTALGAPLLLRALTLFPRGGSFPALTANLWCGALGALYFGVRLSVNWTGPLSARTATSAILAVDAAFLASLVFAVTWNFRRADAAGRRQLKWLLAGAYLGAGPLAATLLLPVLAPGSPWFEPLFVASALMALALPLGVLIGMVRDNLFDVDRLLSATASYSIVLLALLAVLLTVVRGVSELTGEILGIDRASAQTILAMALAALAVALQRRIRPWIERLFFPERRALEEGAGRLRAQLASAKDPGSLLTLLAREAAELLRPRHCVLHAAAAGGFAPAFAQPAEALGRSDPEVLARVQHRPQLHDDDGVALVPIRTGDERIAILELGPKSSGDVYTATDLHILAGLADGAGAELLRFHENERRAQSASMISALRDQRDRAESASREKTRLLAATSHDLRQPLHALSLFVETLSEHPLEPGARELVEQIRESTEALESSFTSLLDLSRIEAGAVEPELQSVALGPLLARLEREFAEAAARKGLALATSHGDLHVRSDPVLLGRIVQNLLSNAIRYTEEGRVALSVRARNGEVLLAVSDTGPGIPRDAQREIFREFRRLASSAARAPGGAGLGLAIVDGLVKLLGHELRLESEPGRGSTFELALPRAEPAARQDAAPAERGAPARGLAGRLILVVDDDAAVREAMAKLLTKWGASVTTAAAGAEALSAVRTGEPPELLIVDYSLAEGENGVQVIASLRAALGAEVPALIVTAETSRESLQGIRAHGIPVLSKPVPPHRLRAAIQSFLAPEG